jgi:potassium efflux system protein
VEFGLGLVVAVFRWCVATAAVLLTLRCWGITAVELKEALAYDVVAAGPAVGRPAITVARILAAILSVVAAGWLSRGMRSFLSARVYPAYAGIDRGARAAINTVVHYSLIVVGFYIALAAIRVPLGALTVVLGTLGLGVGLGLQPLFINFVSGLMILFERHVRIGDLIVVNGKLGEVTRLSMRSTTIKTPDGVELVIPNSDLITQNVVNWTLQETTLRGHVSVGVAYGVDVDLVKRLLFEILEHHPAVLATPPPEVWFMSFGDNSLNFEMVACFRNALDRWRFMTSVRFEINQVFQRHGIEIPFPQRTLSTIGDKPLAVRLIPEPPAPQVTKTPAAGAPAPDQTRPPGQT